MERHATAWRLLEMDESADARYLRSFEAGYHWGEQAQMFLVGPAPVRDDIARVAQMYKELVDAGAAGVEGASAAPLHVASILAPGVVRTAAGKFVTNADTNPYGSATEAFRAELPGLMSSAGGASVDESVMESAFHAGAAFYAFEAQLLLG